MDYNNPPHLNHVSLLTQRYELMDSWSLSRTIIGPLPEIQRLDFAVHMII